MGSFLSGTRNYSTGACSKAFSLKSELGGEIYPNHFFYLGRAWQLSICHEELVAKTVSTEELPQARPVQVDRRQNG